MSTSPGKSIVVLFLSFTFHTDVQFLAWMILALCLYSRGLRTQNYMTVALASLAAAAAVGTRQFGVALVLGLCGTWLLSEQRPFRRASLYLAGIAMPLLMTLWQMSSGIRQSTFSQKVRLIEQAEFLTSCTDFLPQLLWRPTAILRYLALFLLPLAPVLLITGLCALRDRCVIVPQVASVDYQRARRAWLLILVAAYVTAGLCYEYFVYMPRDLMPYLGWLLRNWEFFPYGTKGRVTLTLVTYIFAVLLGWLIVQRFAYRRNWRATAPDESFVMLTGIAVLGLQLLYVQFWDVYLIQLIPFAIFVVAQRSQTWPRWCNILTAVLILSMLCVSALWTRGILSQAEAKWRAAERAHAAGAAPEDIGGNMTWNCYYGAFDEWISHVGGQEAAVKYNGKTPMHDAFFEFIRERYDRAECFVQESPPKPPVNVIESGEYRDRWLQARTMYLVKRSSLR